jgi:hypothetical protein
MAQTTPNLQLTVWNNLSDPYDSGQLANNFVKIDLHDHSGSGKGVQIDGATGIKANSISSVQMGQSAIGSSELKSDSNNPGADSNRAVGTNHIQNLAVTANKIANGTITRAKLNRSDVLAVPVVYHANANGSLPTVTVDGDALYDGYVIDYAMQINVDSTSPTNSGYGQAQIGTTNLNYTHIWRLRYNTVTSAWDFVGGIPYQNDYIGDLTYADIPEKTMYVGWASQRFQYFDIPLKGYYQVTSGGNIDITASDNAVFRTGLYTGATGISTDVAANILANTSAYAYVLGSESGDSNDQVSSITSNAVINITSNTSNGNTLKQAFGLSHKSAPTTTDAILRSQRWIITPLKSLKNFS